MSTLGAGRLDGAVMRQARTSRQGWWWVLGASLVFNLLVLTPTIYMLQLYERVLYSMNELTLIMVSLLALLLLGAMGWADHWRGVWIDRCAGALQAQLQGRLFQAGWQAALRGAPGVGSERQRDLATVRQFLASPGFSGLLDLPWTPVYVVLTWVLHPVLGAAVLGFLLLQAVLAWKGHALSVPVAQAVQATAAHEATHARRQFQQADVVAALGMAAGLRARWLRWHQGALDAVMRSQALSNRLAAASKGLRYLQQSAALGLGAWLTVRGELSAGAMIAGTMLTTRALAPVDAVVNQWKDVLAALQAVAGIDQALELGAAPQPGLIEHRVSTSEALILDDVSAWVPGSDRSILRKLHLVVPPGQVVAVVGSSGAGKSTLARLLAGVWPWAFGGIWRPVGNASVGYLPQEVTLLTGTVAENIARMGQPDPKAVLLAAQRAGVHDLIQRLPKGYDTVVGEGGHPLSGGMTQRLGLARALYGEPRLLVLDEPGAHLDEAGELALEALLQSLRTAGCIAVVVTHARALLRVADRVLLLDRGQIVTDEPSTSLQPMP